MLNQHISYLNLTSFRLKILTWTLVLELIGLSGLHMPIGVLKVDFRMTLMTQPYSVTYPIHSFFFVRGLPEVLV